MDDSLHFELGRRRGHRMLNWLCQISLELTACVRQMEDFLAHHGMRSLVVAKFIPGLSTVAPPMAGIVGLRMSKYLLVNGMGTMLMHTLSEMTAGERRLLAVGYFRHAWCDVKR